MDNFQKNICYNKLFDQCGSLCSELVKQECKFSFCLKLEHFQFSLSSEKHVPARGTRKRPPSYMRRQNRRREDLLKRRSDPPPPPPAKEDAEDDDKNGRKQVEGDLLDKKVPSPLQTTGEEIDNNISLDLEPHLARGLVEDSDVSEKDTEESDSDNEGDRDVSTEDPMQMNNWEQVFGRKRGGLSGRREPSPVPPLRSTRRQRPTEGWAKPLHSDRKHIVDTSGFENSAYKKKIVTVFAPREISREQIMKAMYPSYDSRYLCRTSRKEDKIVYYPASGHRDECSCNECNVK